MALTHLTSPQAAARWLTERVGGELRTDSRQVRPGDGFIAWPGYATDGRRFVAAALDAGATTCLVEAEGVEAFGFADARVAALPSLKAATGPLAAAFYGRPSERLQVVATTGTNGKTSTAWWTAQALTALGRRCGVVGTLGIGEPPLGDRASTVESTGLTTPDPVRLQAALRHFADAGFSACAIEASSIGLVEQRLTGTRIAVALFTNFTQDHLDYHGGMDGYWAAKRLLFGWPGLQAAVVNLDDARGALLALELEGAGLDLWTCAVGQPARLCAQRLRYEDGGLAFELTEGGRSVAVKSRLVGDYNVHNLLVVIGGLRALGVSLDDAVSVVPQLTPVPGRLQRVSHEGQPEVVVDYAHTPDALDKVLRALQPLAASRGGRLVCVVGCGGNRDAAKRPRMAAIGEALADRLLLTSDNPRDEPPAQILAQMVAGLARPDAATVIEDRAGAIHQAIGQADARDVVLIAGKGHEDHQEVRGERRHFSDVEQAETALRARATPAPVPMAMPMSTLMGAAMLVDDAELVGDPGVAFTRVHTDTRNLRPGDLFVALKGERFDAHDFLPQAKAAGAVAAIAERGLAEAGLPGLQVPDSLAALQELAGAWRQRFALQLVAVTGSNGKTTVTQMVAAILDAWLGDRAHATHGNLNNHIGVPLTLLGLRPTHRAAVVELGMNHPGEIARLAELAQPTVALVNNAQREHQEFMASVEAVAHENGRAITELGDAGVAVFPADDAYAPLWRGLAGQRRVMDFALGLDARAAVRGDAHFEDGAWSLQLRTPAGDGTARLAIAGRHNVKNALAAAACALAAGAPLDAVLKGLGAFRPVKGRSQLHGAVDRRGQPYALVDDSYNANPDSVRAAIDVLAELPGPRWLVLGDMGEVGSQGPAFHEEVGAYARERGLDALWTTGQLATHAAVAYGRGARHFDDLGSLLVALAEAPACQAALVKGSRFMRMEQVVQALLTPPPAPPAMLPEEND
ncbi:bifunctional UDP-N-acetylmuramoyl-L-alanyl-D-glutamate--2,6-diaminopimelate ligase MurE/UDP-N-acetylmuramoyl-tripeptide--D-alanyl-D-alanine ligase MurF [Aquabacterium sp. J223]|uniref:bifunctional UDP-N-acetylmuramoyl-L-alanyl-D-glutamate--2, 6-diaminopimelate ligase MurE/UDP-N-acetylmuramoyl-tripeptide--D-alanyl-D-alanine ligase MurF n=1 Tax=Aquabacterium sp. J223 TaxID=2898431 RepID=UPI0021ADE315|nr:bifunctional UDP-N-acetylmuramoyl-L-alanyl-D-glutamate--2,6-diaminopimelate ligase MurE/UDP-N-acetylmuramoyl-tripeptide--D-alanyl-D-alanine ligase MurF [Aquabacterium sp. J223]UUX95667.1 bifunctional UDP-N-acetylmuramoyl-L-alanyl-D-glutamate--2,6-diaminopimelate ligase MurE/UDP-N-acetylmuramoyl-tripeptide--D-alanyl-D-alanine ligase MurF [Aquabacterium sp. J223]